MLIIAPYITDNMLACNSPAQAPSRAAGLTNERVKTLNVQMNDPDDCPGL